MSQRNRDAIRIDQTLPAMAGPPDHCQQEDGGISSAGEAIATPAVSGGTSDGFINNNPSVWSALTSSDVMATSQVEMYISQLTNDPLFYRGEVASLLAKLQAQLSLLDDSLSGDHEVGVALGDLILMANILLRKL